ncbi:MAG: hypothetical protein ABNH38_13005, partial [Tateyamaria sp.]
LITYDLMSLPAALNRMSDEQINQIARNLVTLGTELATRTLDATLSTLDATRSQKEREDSIQLILTVTARIGIAYVLPGFLYKNYGFNFLKKSPLGMNRSDSDIMLELGKILAGPDGRIIEEEMLQIRQSKGIEGVTDKTSVAPMSLHKE